MKRFSIIFFLTLVTILFTSCASYIIPKDSFVKQFSTVDSSNLRTVVIKGPTGAKITYKANSLAKIICYDKSGKELVLTSSPSLESRITLNDGNKIVFYFDRMVLINNKLYGVQSRIFEVKSSIPLSEIVKIEIQDGRKKFSYVNSQK